MPTGLNVALQLIALIVAAAIRLAQPGWMIVLAIIFAFPIVAAMAPLGLAMGTAHRGSLSRTVAAPFVANAVTLVAVALLYPEFGARTSWVPVLRALDAPQPDHDTGRLIGNLALLCYVLALLWTISAIITTHRARVTPLGGHDHRFGRVSGHN
jgi:hypothetical protein